LIFQIVKILKPYWLEFNNVQRFGSLNGSEFIVSFSPPILGSLSHDRM
jgi:hypothetical protein